MPQEIVTYGPSFVGATLIVLVHLFVRRLRFLDRPQSVWPDFFYCRGQWASPSP